MTNVFRLSATFLARWEMFYSNRLPSSAHIFFHHHPEPILPPPGAQSFAPKTLNDSFWSLLPRARYSKSPFHSYTYTSPSVTAKILLIIHLDVASVARDDQPKTQNYYVKLFQLLKGKKCATYIPQQGRIYLRAQHRLQRALSDIKLTQGLCFVKIKLSSRALRVFCIHIVPIPSLLPTNLQLGVCIPHLQNTPPS